MPQAITFAYGLLPKLEFVEDKTTKEPFDPALTIAMAVHEQGLLQNPGIMMYPGTGSADGRKGDHIIISPPYSTTPSGLEMIVAQAYRAVQSAFEQVLVHNKTT